MVLYRISSTWLLELFELFYKYYNAIVDVFLTPLSEFIDPSKVPAGAGKAFTWAIKLVTNFFFGDTTLLEFMIGTGIALYLLYQFLIWLGNIVT